MYGVEPAPPRYLGGSVHKGQIPFLAAVQTQINLIFSLLVSSCRIKKNYLDCFGKMQLPGKQHTCVGGRTLPLQYPGPGLLPVMRCPLGRSTKWCYRVTEPSRVCACVRLSVCCVCFEVPGEGGIASTVPYGLATLLLVLFCLRVQVQNSNWERNDSTSSFPIGKGNVESLPIVFSQTCPEQHSRKETSECSKRTLSLCCISGPTMKSV